MDAKTKIFELLNQVEQIIDEEIDEFEIMKILEHYDLPLISNGITTNLKEEVNLLFKGVEEVRNND